MNFEFAINAIFGREKTLSVVWPLRYVIGEIITSGITLQLNSSSGFK